MSEGKVTIRKVQLFDGAPFRIEVRDRYGNFWFERPSEEAFSDNDIFRLLNTAGGFVNMDCNIISLRQRLAKTAEFFNGIR